MRIAALQHLGYKLIIKSKRETQMATKTTTTPSFSMPAMPKIENEALSALFKDNMEFAVKTQKMMFDAAEASMTRQFGMVREVFEKASADVLKFDASKKPEAYAEEARAAAEQAQAMVQTEIDSSLKVGQEVMDMVSKRVAANTDKMKTLAS